MSRHRSGDAAVLRELRQTRQARRLGDTEWFDVLYRVYLFALGGLVAVVVASDAIEGLVDDGLTTGEILTRGPSAAGVLVAVAVAIGLRNGADGGPVSVESADVQHVLLSPIDRRRTLLLPVIQRLRSVAFVPALVGAIVAQLVAREVEGSRAAWAASGAMFGVCVGVLYVASAAIAHARSLPRWVASTGGGVVVAAQVVAAVSAWRSWDEPSDQRFPGPANLVGSLLFWGIRQRSVDLFAIGATVVMVAMALGLAGRLRLEPLERRGQLVSQLRFAATVQDIRTVVLLRRQLRAEAVRTRPWISIGTAPNSHRSAERSSPPNAASRPIAGSHSPSSTLVWRRGAIALSRLPIGRVLRIVGLSIVAGVSGSLIVSSSWLFTVPFVGALFLTGLEAIEPLAQEIDRPDLTDSLPCNRGWLFTHHLVAPAALLAVVGIVAAVAAAIVEPNHTAGAFAVAVPVMWGGAIGPVASTVRDAPAPTAVAHTTVTGRDRSTESPFALPEFAGASNIMSGLAPIIFSATALVPVAAMRADPNGSTVVRSTVAVALCLAVLVWWISRRDMWAIRLRTFFAEGRATT